MLERTLLGTSQWWSTFLFLSLVKLGFGQCGLSRSSLLFRFFLLRNSSSLRLLDGIKELYD